MIRKNLYDYACHCRAPSKRLTDVLNTCEQNATENSFTLWKFTAAIICFKTFDRKSGNEL